MVEIQIAYQGKLRCSAQHVDSGATLLTDAPKDNLGNGESFSPTDLVATALGTCMLTTMGIVAQRMNVDLTGSSIIVTKEMTPQPTRRVGRLNVTLNLSKKVSDDQRQTLENAANTCPVARSLHPDVLMPTTFNWG